MSTDEAERLRRELRRHDGGRGKRFAPELRERLVAFAEARRAEGASWKAIATELGACVETLRRWCTPEAGVAPRLRPVQIVAAPVFEAPSHSVKTVVTPNGLRIEGLGLDEVVALVRALG